MNKTDFQNPRGCKALDQAQSPFWFWNDKLEEMMDLPGMKDEMRRPMMLMIRAEKK